ncbi:TonB-dependent receptor [Novacetimonas hansenii]|uniref:TonB-dependent receptor n=1 Tax=Novacetimonas hansenii TaxID=436 RepID=UPI00177E8EE2|nr:TonB-dependent receptor [Novacetimonas hansenii]MBL7235534.1 TonB-dependent receptor [Novacetimonas hansenii]QOF94468.1 TonB-dependent receptor [Novacetimonas hansenii]
MIWKHVKYLHLPLSPIIMLALSTQHFAHAASAPHKKAEEHTAPKNTATHRVIHAGANATAAPEKISVVGSGSTRQMQSLSRRDLQYLVPGTTPLKAVGNMPGVQFSSSDPLGIDLWSQSFYMHGFTSDQLGFTVDGIALGGQGYESHDGVPVNRVISNENISHTDVSQGAGGLDTPSTSNLGGTVRFYSDDPSDKMGGKVSQTFGSYNAFRTFARFDSGKLNKSGTKFYMSYDRRAEDKWLGGDSQFQQMVNTKLVQPINDHTTFKAYFDWSSEAAASYLDNSLEMLNKVGYDSDYYYPNYGAALNAANGNYPSKYQGLSDPKNAAYYRGIETSSYYVGGMSLDSKLTTNLESKTTFYGVGKRYDAWWTSPYVSSPSGAPLAAQDQAMSSRRLGFQTDLIYHFRHHTFDAGFWYENSTYNPEMDYFNEPNSANGTPYNEVAHKGEPFMIGYGEAFNTNTYVFHLQDTYKILPNLTLHAGFRTMVVNASDRVTHNDIRYTNSTQIPAGSLTAEAAALPQFSGNWRFAPHNEFYFDISKNMQAYPEGGYNMFSPWGAKTQSDFNALKKNLRPETDWVYEIGYRLQTRRVIGLLNLYHTDFSNRQQSISVGPLVTAHSLFENVGSVNMNGVDASVTFIPVRHLSIYNSISYNSSKFENNLTSGGVLYHLKNKQEPNYAHLMYKNSLKYSIKGINIHFDTLFMGKRYLSYTNDSRVPSYWLENFGVSYTLHDVSVAKNLKFDFNIYNITNERYISNMGSGGNPLSGDYNSLQVGAPRSFYGTISADF